MALDEPKENDEVFDVDEFKFCVEKELMDKAKPMTVDMSRFGFAINSSLELGGGNCGSCTSC